MKIKYQNLCDALCRLDEAVVDFQKLDDSSDTRVYRAYRDSMIQRFEFCTDLFWKYLKFFLEEELKRAPEFNAPKSIVKSACNAKLVTENDAEFILKMIEDRNMLY